jgi:hypothetical protein
MKIDLELLQLRKDENLFVAGSQLKDKIQLGIKEVTELFYDTETGLVTVVCKKRITYIRDWFSVTPKQDVKLPKIQETMHHAMRSGISAQAQVSGPEGVKSAQVSNPTTDVPRKPGRPAKYQGEVPQ